MTANMEYLLQRLNQAMQPRTYTIRVEGEQFFLSMPLGGEYPPATAAETVERLVRITQAANGGAR